MILKTNFLGKFVFKYQLKNGEFYDIIEMK